MKYEVYQELDRIGKQVSLLAIGFAIGAWYMNERMDELEEKVNALLTGQLRAGEQRAIGHATGRLIPSGTEDSELGTPELSSVEYGK